MKTTDEVLQEVKVAGVRAREEERKWTQLRRECQSPAVLACTWFAMLLACSLIGAFWLRSHPGDWAGLPFAPFASLVLMAPGIFISYQRRQKALLKIIALEAPRLLQKLRTEGIA